jgi:pyridoxine 5'-phosphate synthase PdxJ
MMRINLNLDPLCRFYPIDDQNKNFLRHSIAAELAGVDGIFAETGEAYNPIRRKLIESLVETIDVSVTVKSSYDEKWIEAIKDIKPSMVIFEYDDSYISRIESCVAGVQVENILAGMISPLDIDSVKQCAKLKCDYVFFDGKPFIGAKNINEEIEELNKISKLCALCGRLSIGAGIMGEFSMRKLQKLADLNSIQELIIGQSVISESALNGYGKALDSIRNIVL